MERLKLRADLDEMPVLVQCVKDGAERFVSTVSTKLQKRVEVLIDTVKQHIQVELLNGRKKFNTQFYWFPERNYPKMLKTNYYNVLQVFRIR